MTDITPDPSADLSNQLNTAGASRRVLLMGVLNVTPDSFSDGGSFNTPAKAIAQAEKLVEEGAEVLDLGAESTRPGAQAIGPEDEWNRLKEVLSALRDWPVKISVDTRNKLTMLRAIDAGTTMINNVGGLTDRETLEKIRLAKADYLAMHMHRDPQTMQKEPLPPHVALSEVASFFDAAYRELVDSGFTHDKIWLDPGIGFGKTDGANARLLLETNRWSQKYNIAIGISRKSFLGRTLSIPEPRERDGAGAMLELGLIAAGASMIRTHSPRLLRSLLRAAEGQA